MKPLFLFAILGGRQWSRLHWLHAVVGPSQNLFGRCGAGGGGVFPDEKDFEGVQMFFGWMGSVPFAAHKLAVAEQVFFMAGA